MVAPAGLAPTAGMARQRLIARPWPERRDEAAQLVWLGRFGGETDDDGHVEEVTHATIAVQNVCARPLG